MTTLTEFYEVTIGGIKRSSNDQYEDSLDQDIVPLCGMISHRGIDSGDCWSSNYNLYLVEESGHQVHVRQDLEFVDLGDLQYQLAKMLGVELNEVQTSFGSIGVDKSEFCTIVSWHLLYITAEKFDQIRRSKRVSVVADRHDGLSAPRRFVAPSEIRVKEAEFDFVLASTNIQFVAKHRNSFEYVTESGVKIHDTRNRVSKISVGGLRGDEDEHREITVRQDVLDEFLYSIWRGSRSTWNLGSEIDPLRDFAGLALHRLASDTDIPCEEGSIVSDEVSWSPFLRQ